ncbi:MAG: FIST N-terminal domain-containing protein [Candidatus Aenigmatarchaeota archaeon]
MEMKVHVQTKEELDATKIIEFIDGCKDGKIAIVHSSVKDENDFRNFFEYLVENLKLPFVGMRVSGTITPEEGYIEDAVAVAVLCGDFEVDVFSEEIDFDDPQKTVDKTIPKLEGKDLCIVYSANYCRQDIFLDFILRRVQDKYPEMQILGGVSAPEPVVVTSEGISEKDIVCIGISGLEYDFELYSGFEFDPKSDDVFTVTKSDDFYIREINGKIASEEYSKIQHVRPYMLNMITKYILSKSDISKAADSLYKMGDMIPSAMPKVVTNLLGDELENGQVEAIAVLEMGEDRDDYVVFPSYKPEGKVLKRTMSFKEDHLNVYDKACERYRDSKAMLMVACSIIQFYIDFDFGSVAKRLKKLKCPYMVSFTFGEFGATLPYKGLEQNVVNGVTVKVVGFK